MKDIEMQKTTNQIYQEIESCRLCCSEELDSVLDLGYQPPANSLRKNLNEPEPHAPLELVHCRNCDAVQLTATVDPDYLFTQYVWVTATSSTARGYSLTYCNEVLSRSVEQHPFVVEIASNDGTFLKQFKEKGCEILGVDPAKNIANIASKAGIPTLPEFFDASIALKILDENRRPNIVMARNVIPHVKEIHSIAEGISTLLDDKGIAVIEFHYAKKIVDELHYDSIYHEHLFYFSIKSISALFKQYGLAPFDLFTSPISGGSLVIFLSKKNIESSDALKNYVKAEESFGLNHYQTWRKFGMRSIQHAQILKEIVENYAKKSRLIAYGASARSSTLLNFAGISNKEIECVIDRSPLKHGLFTPGTNIPIISYEEGLSKCDGKTILLLAWNFEEEIIQDLRAAGFKGDIIVPLPNEVRIR